MNNCYGPKKRIKTLIYNGVFFIFGSSHLPECHTVCLEIDFSLCFCTILIFGNASFMQF